VSATLDDYRWLVSEAAQPWLDGVTKDFGESVTPGLLQQLRKDLSTDRAHLIVEQVELRRRAREKFSLADRMFFTRKGLEQATDEILANYKAARFQTLGVLDLCCGIGGDLIAQAQRCHTLGVDRDPIIVVLAAANVSALGSCAFGHHVKDADAQMCWQTGGEWHCDPDRRVDDLRTTRLDSFDPPQEFLDRFLKHNSSAAIKLAPATEVPPHWWDACEREWLGSRGECRQQVAWFGSLARHPGQHAATVVAADGNARTVVGTFSEPVPVAEQLGRYVYEPHAAVLAANLTGALCREHNLAAVSAGIGYLTGDRLISDAALAAFEVREVLPFDRKQLRAWCREHAIGRLEIKKRGVTVDPRQLRAEIVAAGDNEATLILTPVEGRVRALVASRI